MTVLADSPAGRPEVAVVRQPIADDRHNVVGYELLFGGERVSLDSATDAKATSALLVDAFGDIGLDQLAGRHPAWMSSCTAPCSSPRASSRRRTSSAATPSASPISRATTSPSRGSSGTRASGRAASRPCGRWAS